MKIHDAMVCIDCDEIIDVGERKCVCGSSAIFPLSKWFVELNGKEDVEQQDPPPAARLRDKAYEATQARRS